MRVLLSTSQPELELKTIVGALHHVTKPAVAPSGSTDGTFRIDAAQRRPLAAVVQPGGV
jgi:hypothetical protein